jgi:hypothetical protein
MPPGKAQEWLLFAQRIRVNATDADIAVSPILQNPIDWRTLEPFQSAPWDSGRLGKHIDVWCHECALETECRVVRFQKMTQHPVGG